MSLDCNKRPEGVMSLNLLDKPTPPDFKFLL